MEDAHLFDDDEWRSPAQWLFDTVLLPGLVLLLTSLVYLAASVAIWAVFRLWAAILSSFS